MHATSKLVHANTCQDPVCPCRVAMRVRACKNEVIIELYRTFHVNHQGRYNAKRHQVLLQNADTWSVKRGKI